nr:MAG TPA: hypothetical protein [Caudoviricetes sp.]
MSIPHARCCSKSPACLNVRFTLGERLINRGF